MDAWVLDPIYKMCAQPSLGLGFLGRWYCYWLDQLEPVPYVHTCTRVLLWCEIARECARAGRCGVPTHGVVSPLPSSLLFSVSLSVLLSQTEYRERERRDDNKP